MTFFLKKKKRASLTTLIGSELWQKQGSFLSSILKLHQWDGLKRYVLFYSLKEADPEWRLESK